MFTSNSQYQLPIRFGADELLLKIDKAHLVSSTLVEGE